MIHVGFTATQRGMTEVQRRQLFDYLKQLKNEWGGITLHHGECVGGDFEADLICGTLEIPTIGHPPLDRKKWAKDCQCSIHRMPREYRVRNTDIVMETGFLIAAPKTRLEELRSGTWMTIRIARNIGKIVVILDPEEPRELPIMRKRRDELPY